MCLPPALILQALLGLSKSWIYSTQCTVRSQELSSATAMYTHRAHALLGVGKSLVAGMEEELRPWHQQEAPSRKKETLSAVVS